MITRSQFEELSNLLEKSRVIVSQKLTSDKSRAHIWKAAQDQLNTLAALVDTTLIPTLYEKEQITLGVMLANAFNSPQDSHDLSPLFELSNKYHYLGIPDIDQNEALGLFNKIF